MELIPIPIVISQSTSIGYGYVLHCAYRSLLIFHHKPITHMHCFSELYAPSKVSELIVFERIAALAFENQLFALNFSVVIGILKDFQDAITIFVQANI